MNKIILTTAIAFVCAFTAPMVITAQNQESPKPVNAAPKATKAPAKLAKVENPCKGPANLTVTPKLKGFTAKWDAVEGAKGYEIFIRDVDGKHGVNSYPSATNTYTTTALAEGTDYIVHVTSKGCMAGPKPSEASNKVKFKTLGVAPAKSTAPKPTKTPSAPVKETQGK